MRRSLTITAAISSLAVLAALSGCSASGGSADKVLTVWTFKQSEVKALQAIGADWGKQNGMTVKVSVFTPDDTYTTKVQAAAKSGTLPDILSVHSEGQDWQLAQAGIVDDLTKDFTSSWQKQFLPGVMSSSELTADHIASSGNDQTTTLKKLHAGHLYSVPFLAGTPAVVFANKPSLKKAGVDTSTPPSTWQEWVTDMKPEGLETMRHSAAAVGPGYAALRFVDSVEFVHERVLGALVVSTPVESVAIHHTCSTTQLGENEAMTDIARFVSADVYVPVDWGCCAFAGDRGLLHPELTESATRAEAAEIASREFAEYVSANRTCELGMSRATGHEYRHILEVLEEATR